MDKINFQDGTKVSSAKVTIDEVDYTVTPARYSGATPLSSTIMNTMQTNIENAINQNADNIGGQDYDNTQTYEVGDIVKYEEQLYICIENVDTPEEFDDTKWSQTDVLSSAGGNEIAIGDEETVTGKTKLWIEDDSIDSMFSEVEVSPTEPTGPDGKVWFKRGKNLFNKKLATAGYYYIDGTNYIGNANWKYIIIKAKPNTTYVASGVSSNNQSIGIAEFDSNGTVITGGFSYKNGSFTTNSNTSFLAVSCRIADLDTYMLEQGQTATTYEAYVEPEIYTRNNNNVYENFMNNTILESGGDSAGRYIKYINGTMICYGKATFSVNFATANTTVQLLNPFTFPAQFVENPTVMVNTFNDADYTFATVCGTIRNSTEISKIVLYRPFTGSGSVGLGYIAIGIWK